MTAVTGEDYVRALEAGHDGLAEWFGQQLDAAADDVARWLERPDALRLSALDYAKRLRLRVLPLRANSKIPLGGEKCCGGTHAHGSTTASDDLALVGDWWDAHPDANVGIATGYPVDVIDQDGPQGAISWALMGRASAWPAVLGMATTVRAGGVHRYIAATGDGNGAKIAPGIDYRGRGGYVVAPPSTIDGVRYAWAQPLTLGGTR